MAFSRILPIGAEYQPGEATHFRVWAPHRRQVTVVLEAKSDSPRESSPSDVPQHSVQLERERNGYWSAAVPMAAAGTLYCFRLDGDTQLFPDPASRFQPQGVHGPSQVVDPQRFRW